MEIKQCVVIGGLLWCLMFTAIAILSIIPWLYSILWLQDLLFFVVLGLLTYLLAKPLTSNKPEKAIVVGLGFALIFFFLDLTVAVPLFIKSYTLLLTDWQTWLSYLEIIIVSYLTSKHNEFLQWINRLAK